MAVSVLGVENFWRLRKLGGSIEVPYNYCLYFEKKRKPSMLLHSKIKLMELAKCIFNGKRNMKLATH